jgi:glycosyltransferase involved in cell wall biosynthesis
MAYNDIISKYKENDIFIHFGSHEGLGLGFYESLYCGTPILTMDWTPNNELITDNLNGWLVETSAGNIYDNTISLINRGIVSEINVRNKIIYIIFNKEITLKVIKYTLNNRSKLSNSNKKNFEEKLKNILLST